jgi:hypothetical protein
MMPSRLIAAAFLLSPLLPARSIDARKVGAVQANGEGGFLTGASLSIGGNDVVSLNDSRRPIRHPAFLTHKQQSNRMLVGS